MALGHSRLAIIDLSPTGSQPMTSHCGRYVISFNGEIYNFASLRERLTGYGKKFRGTSDTEVALAAISHWGLTGALERFNGMFAFALWDGHKRRLSLIRDRLGEKPLYFGRAGAALIFGSELKALRAYRGLTLSIDRVALAELLRFGYISAPRSIYAGIEKLSPGCVMHVDVGSGRVEPPQAFWSLSQIAARKSNNLLEAAADLQVEGLREVLLDAVNLRMVADVPLGAFLSGGVDSSLITAMMQAQSSAPVRTYSIGFGEVGFDESGHARAVARHLGTDHTEFQVTSTDALELVPRIPEIYDEPFADPSQLPTILVCALARRHVTVALTGDGGDELFAGYRRYASTERIWGAVRRLSPAARRQLSAALQWPSAETWDVAGRALQRVGLPVDGRLGERVRRVADVVEATDSQDLYRRMMSKWQQPTDLVLGTNGLEAACRGHNLAAGDLLESMLLSDAVTYLPDDILVKVDRASMASSLECRVPLLDHRVVEYAWRMPTVVLRRGGQGKWPLRRLLDTYVPRALVERPKQGFDVPLGQWLRGPLREWAGDLLSTSRLERQGYLDARPIAQRFAEHVSGRQNWQGHLWHVLMFEAWLERHEIQPATRSPE